MNNQARTNQGGSVASFLVIGVILAVITLGGIYFVQHRQQSQAPTPAPSVAQSPSADTKTPGTSTSPSPSVKPSTSPKPSASPSPSTVPSETPQTGVLPATGPADDLLLSALPIVLLTGVTAAYAQSRYLRRKTTS